MDKISDNNFVPCTVGECTDIARIKQTISKRYNIQPDEKFYYLVCPTHGRLFFGRGKQDTLKKHIELNGTPGNEQLEKNKKSNEQLEKNKKSNEKIEKKEEVKSGGKRSILKWMGLAVITTIGIKLWLMKKR